MISFSDYYPFGSIMPMRSSSLDKYRYGFNGQEKENSVNGSYSSTSAEFWMYDGRLGRRWDKDPLGKNYPFQSPYSCFNNNPINYSDPFGLEGEFEPNDEPNSRFLGVSKEAKTNQNPGSNWVPLTNKLFEDEMLRKGITSRSSQEWNKMKGWLLEDAYLRSMLMHRNMVSVTGSGQRTIPDGLSWDWYLEFFIMQFYLCEFHEIKAYSGTLYLTKQIKAQIHAASNTQPVNSNVFRPYQNYSASELQIAKLTIVTFAPQNGKIPISQTVIDEANHNNVRLYWVMAFYNTVTGEIGFSAPVQINSVNQRVSGLYVYDEEVLNSIISSIFSIVPNWSGARMNYHRTNETGNRAIDMGTQ